MQSEFELNFIETGSVSRGAGIYRRSDMTIEYTTLEDPRPALLVDEIEKRLGVRKKDFLLIADTLTLTFSGADCRLSGCDFFTNEKQWEVSEEACPARSAKQGVLCLSGISDDNDRFSLNEQPKVQISSDRNCIRIVIQNVAEQDQPECVKLADNFIVGLNQGNISSLYLLEPEFLN